MVAPIITIKASYPGSLLKPSLLDLSIVSESALNPAYPAAAGTMYDAWGITQEIGYDEHTHSSYSARIYSTYEADALVFLGKPSEFAAALGAVNWLVNWYTGSNAGISYQEVQAAIWKLMGADWTQNIPFVNGVSVSDVNNMYNQALLHASFVPDAGQKLAALVEPFGTGCEHAPPVVVEVPAAKIGDRVWDDVNQNGIQDTGEIGIAGAAVELVRANGGSFDVLASTQTNANGEYAFAGLMPGFAYQVRFTKPSGFESVSPRQVDGDTSSGSNSDAYISDVVTLAPGEYNKTIDAGFYEICSTMIGDYVWHDANANGKQDDDEYGMPDVEVALYNSANQLISSMFTNEDGKYLFDNLAPGSYKVRFNAPLNYIFTKKDGAADDVDSDADQSGFTKLYDLSNGQHLLTVDAGLYSRTTYVQKLGDRVWLDQNMNGVQDADEKGVAGVTVELHDASNTKVAETVTNAEGIYGFSDLIPGDYRVRFVTTGNYRVTQKDQGASDELDSDADKATGYTGSYTLNSGDINLTVDAGLYQLASLGDFVWRDLNLNGLQDANEPGVSEIRVELYDGSNKFLQSTLTNSAGYYGFNDLEPGAYKVKFVVDDFGFTSQNVGANDNIDSDADQNGWTATYILHSGENNKTVDAGLFQLAAIGDYVWLDSNANGLQDADEKGVKGVTVELYDAANKLVGSKITNAEGKYKFDHLMPGKYSVHFVNTDYNFSDKDVGVDDAIDSDAGANGYTKQYELAVGEYNNTVDAGIYKYAAIGDRVWLDANANGIQDSGEKGFAGVQVSLFDAAGNFVKQMSTSALGEYKFEGLKPGDYKVKFAAQAGYDYSPKDAGSNDTVDSDADKNGLTKTYTLKSGEYNNTVDAGLYKLAAIGDYVWHDLNADGIQDTNEPGLKGIAVHLMDASGNMLGEQITNASGWYKFDNLQPGSYTVHFENGGYNYTSQYAGGNIALDSDANSTGLSKSYTLTPGQYNDTVDAGLYKNAAIGDRVWLDENANGVQDASEKGLVGVQVSLFDATGKFVTQMSTNAAGNYKFDGLRPGAYQVKFVAPAGYDYAPKDVGSNDTVDSDADKTTGLTKLYTLQSGEYNDTVDAGIYKLAAIGDKVWHDLDADGIQDANEPGLKGMTVHLMDDAGKMLAETTTNDAGWYKFANLQPGNYKVHFEKNDYRYTSKDVGGDDTVDSDADSSTGLTLSYNLKPGQYNDTVDAGLYKLASLGDFVWRDLNLNGLQDKNEPGVSEIRVELYDGAGTFVKSTLTNTKGYYGFNDLMPGAYKVKFVVDNFGFTSKDVGSDDTIDSDADKDGWTKTYILNSGDNNNTIDAGLFQLAAIGDRVWLDNNANGLQDDGEKGIAGVAVSLFDGAGNFIATKNTNSEGRYKFDHLMPGDYQVRFANAAYVFTDKDVGSDDAIDSDANATGQTKNYTLSVGEYNNTVDAGLYKLAAIGDKVWLDANANGIQDTGEKGFANIQVTLLDASGATLKQMFTNDQGEYKFDSLKPGSYKVKFAAPAGYDYSPKDIGSNDSVDSDADKVGTTIAYTLNSGEYNDTVDAGLYKLAAIGDTVWHDKNANGLQDAGEEGLAGRKVHLFDASGNMLGERITNAAGFYKFDNLQPGTYKVHFENEEFRFSPQNVGSNDAVDSDADVNTGMTASYTLAPGEYNDTVDAGMYRYAALGDHVWHDLNANGLQDTNEPGIENVTVHLYGENGLHLTTKTNATGDYHFYNLVPGSYSVQFDALPGYYISKADAGSDDAIDSDANVSTGKTINYVLSSGEVNNTVDCGMYKLAEIGDRVWLDYKHNSLQDAGEPGLAGATIVLHDSTGKAVATTTTNAQGLYKFTDLTPGTYWLEATYVFGYGFVPKDVGKNVGHYDEIDSDANYNGVTAKTQLTSGESDMTWDFGLTPLVLDMDGNGIQTVSRANSAGAFDLFGNGAPVQSGWISGGDAFLAVDSNNNGSIDDINELFGGQKQGDGFAKLARFDSNGDGVVNADDADFAELKIWRDANGNHQTDAGELLNLVDAGVSSLNVGYVAIPELDNNGNLHLERSLATLADGSSIDMTDVYFNVSAMDVAAAGINLPTMAELLSSGDNLDNLLPAGYNAATYSESGLDFDTAVLAGLQQLAHAYDQSNAYI